MVALRQHRCCRGPVSRACDVGDDTLSKASGRPAQYFSSCSGRTRTCDTRINGAVFYQLNYRAKSGGAGSRTQVLDWFPVGPSSESIAFPPPCGVTHIRS